MQSKHRQKYAEDSSSDDEPPSKRRKSVAAIRKRKTIAEAEVESGDLRDDSKDSDKKRPEHESPSRLSSTPSSAKVIITLLLNIFMCSCCNVLLIL